ncbi:MAG: MBL fold metallo-hydrolase [Rhodothermales bacterium]
MPTLHLLGTGAGYSEPHRTTTMLALSADDNLVIIDCGGDVIQRVLAAGLDPMALKHLILSHEHPDHISGFPLFMEKIWLAGRRTPIPIYGPPEALDQARRTFATFNTSRWEGLPERIWHETWPKSDSRALTRLLEDDAWDITAAPVAHGVPTIGFRIHCKTSGTVVAYSCDTEPTENVITLAQNADLLVHEATGEYPGHSSATQAAEMAVKSGAKKLVLVHLPANLDERDLEEAKKIFPNTAWGFELGRHEI